MSNNTKSTRKIKNNTLAMLVAAAAIPVKPNMLAIIATTRKISAHLSIAYSPLVIQFKNRRLYVNCK